MSKFNKERISYNKQGYHNRDLKIHDVFLNFCRKEKIEVAVEMYYQVKKTGLIVGFDQQVIVMACIDEKHNTCQQMIYKDNVLSVNPILPVNIIFSREDQEKLPSLQREIPLYANTALHTSPENAANFS